MEGIDTINESLLIIGGSGFIGSNITKAAVKRRFKITVLSLNIVDDINKIKGVEYVSADISNLNQLNSCLPNFNFDYVINVSGYINHSGFFDGGRKILDSQFLGLENILVALNRSKLKRFINIGSSDEYGDHLAPQDESLRESPISPYAVGKVVSTNLLQMLHRSESLPIVIVRLYLVYGPGQKDDRFIPQIIKGLLSGQSFPVSLGSQLRDFTYIDDIVEGTLKILSTDMLDGEVVNLASGQPVKIMDVIQTIQKIIGKGRPEIGKVPYRNGENMSLYADVAKIKKILDWKPEVLLIDGLRETIIHFQDKSN